MTQQPITEANARLADEYTRRADAAMHAAENTTDDYLRGLLVDEAAKWAGIARHLRRLGGAA